MPAAIPYTEITPQMIAECKAELPPVKVQLPGGVVWGRTSGRLNKFASVTVDEQGTLHRGNRPWYDFQFSWEAVCRSVVTGVPLRI